MSLCVDDVSGLRMEMKIFLFEEQVQMTTCCSWIGDKDLKMILHNTNAILYNTAVQLGKREQREHSRVKGT